MERCYLCQRILGGGSPQENDFDKEVAFRMFLRYLKLECKSFAQSREEGIQVDFCKRCSPLLKEFYKWYQHLDSVYLCINESLQALYDVMGDCGSFEGEHPGEIGASQGFNRILRDEARMRCSLKILANPVVELEKISIPSKTDKLEVDHVIEAAVQEEEDEGPPVLQRQDIIPSYRLERPPSPAISPPCQQNVEWEEAAKWICNVCKFSATGKNHLRLHSQRKHAFHLYSNQLPPATTEEHLEQAICRIITTPEGVPGCETCFKRRLNNDGKRIHILNLHLPQIIEWLEVNKKPQEGSEGTTEASWDCNICQFSGKSEGHLLTHSKRKHAFHLYSQQLPLATTEEQLEQAIQKVIQIPHGVQNCLKCSRGIHRRDGKRLHILNCHFPQVIQMLNNSFSDKSKCSKVFTCSICRKSFQNRGRLYFHKKTHQKTGQMRLPENPKVSCPICNHKSQNLSTLRTHSLRKHAFQVFFEQLPPNTTPNQLEQVIIDLVNSEGAILAGCLCCAEGFRSRSEKRLHILNRHIQQVIEKLQGPHRPHLVVKEEPSTDNGCQMNKNTRVFSCVTCKKGFGNRGALFRHKKIHRNQKLRTEPRLNCDLCSYSSWESRDVKIHKYSSHMIQVLGDKIPPGVTEVDLTAAMTNILNSAPRYRCPKAKTKLKYFGCVYCSYWYPTRGRLNLHVLEAHLEKVTETLNPVVVQSPEAGTSLTVQKPRVKILKPQCPKCEMTFPLKMALKRHLLAYHGEGGPPKCPHCKYHFPKSVLDIHLKAVHTLESYRHFLPAGTTSEMLETTLRSFIQHFPGTLSYYCGLCSKKGSKIGDTKIHLMENHQVTVIQSLQTALNSSPENDVDLINPPQENPQDGTLPKIPSGVIAHELEAAIEDILLNARVVFREENGVQMGFIGCPHCSLDFNHLAEVRMHVLSSHFEHAVSLLGKESESPVVPKEERF